MSGVILAVLIALLVAWLWFKGREKLKLKRVSGKYWAYIIVIVVVLLVILYGATGHVSSH